jgi:hypothetical protein
LTRRSLTALEQDSAIIVVIEMSQSKWLVAGLVPGVEREPLRRIGARLYDETGVEFPPELMRFDVYDNARGKRAGQGRIAYRGPLVRGGDPPRVKLDLTADELLALPPITRSVAHAYTDAPQAGIQARCYAFEEVFGEKIRALGERSRPRDLYDVINLFRNGDFPAAAAAIRDVVQRKCAFKAIPFPTLESLNPFRAELIGEWQNMLGHQLPALPPVESFLDALPEFFRWLAGTPQPAALSPHPLARNTQLLRGPAGAFGGISGHRSYMETVRFAASNRMVVELDYRDEQGRRSTRMIEPYSLRRTQEGRVLLMARRVDNGQPRSYRVDRILGARATERAFVPQYPVELTPTGPLVIAELQRGGGSIWGLS